MPFLVVIAGGQDSRTYPTKYVESYYPGSNCSLRLQDTPTTCSDPILCFIGGKLYLGILVGYCTKLWIYDPATNVWTSTNFCSLATHNRQPFLCTNDSIYIMDDYIPEVFNTITQTWSYLMMPNYMTGSQACMAPTVNGQIVVFGGSRNPPVQIYDIATDYWTTGPMMPAGMTTVQGCHLIPGTNNILTLQTGGGYDACIYNADTNTWLTPYIGSTINLSLNDLLLYGNQILAFNGGNPTYYGAYAYCPSNSTKWQRIPDTFPLQFPRVMSSVAMVPLSYLNLNSLLSNCLPTNFPCT